MSNMSLKEARRILGGPAVDAYLEIALTVHRLRWALDVAHDHMLIDPTGRGRTSRAFHIVDSVLKGKPTTDSQDPIYK